MISVYAILLRMSLFFCWFLLNPFRELGNKNFADGVDVFNLSYHFALAQASAAASHPKTIAGADDIIAVEKLPGGVASCIEAGDDFVLCVDQLGLRIDGGASQHSRHPPSERDRIELGSQDRTWGFERIEGHQ
jgi:hypothetical protein